MSTRECGTSGASLSSRACIRMGIAHRAHSRQRRSRGGMLGSSHHGRGKRNRVTSRMPLPLALSSRRLQSPISRATARKRHSFFSVSLCLSRACLGKMITFAIKWRKNSYLNASLWIAERILPRPRFHTNAFRNGRIKADQGGVKGWHSQLK